MASLNHPYSSLAARRRYEVWFLRFALCDGSGAWWFRYLLMNPSRGGCNAIAQPVQVWATWFPRDGHPQTFIQGFPVEQLQLRNAPFSFAVSNNAIDEDSCRGHLLIDGHDVAWNLRYSSTFAVTMSDKGWIGFSRTPHSDAVLSGGITLDGRIWRGSPLAFGLQGHNCGYRHRSFWVWTHAFFSRPAAPPSTFEALVYDMPFGLLFRKAVLWHDGVKYEFRKLRELKRDRQGFHWSLLCDRRDAMQVEIEINGSGPMLHHLPYMKTDCSGTFEVANNSTARARLRLLREGELADTLETHDGAVLEMAGP